MITVVYGAHNGTQDSIAWWLCNSMTKNIGPQVYKFLPDSKRWNGKAQHIDGLLYSGLVIDAVRHDEYIECHRLMENVEGDIIAPMRKFEKDYDMLIWSNFFGDLKYPEQKIDCDKLIICDEDAYEDCFHYVLNHAYSPLPDNDTIDNHTELWWSDHKVVNDNVTDNWKKVWYDNYHQKMHDEFDKGNLLYMWQLNYMHWDVNSLVEGNDIKPTLEPADNLKRLLFEKFFSKGSVTTDKTLWANPDALYIRDPHWFNKADKILEFLEIERCNKINEALDKYKYEYTIRRDWFDSLVKKTLS